MEEFSIVGENGNYLKVTFQEVYGFPESTCHWGGYEVRAAVEIKSGSFTAHSIFWTSTGELYEFFKRLKACNEEVEGNVDFANYEDNLRLTANYNNLGQVNIKGNFYALSDLKNELLFEFNSDQSYLNATIREL
ncbi:WapI family immunity protein [Rufibacter aurantiacus]|uniref:WapI family immunity protein n=1 Tax=Rufibacter aurantiacus TaxID=2817374 RepID=UPI001B312AD7|nr:hypothetical protein [Rufibacter aurantiacus]